MGGYVRQITYTKCIKQSLIHSYYNNEREGAHLRIPPAHYIRVLYNFY